ncbi:hypothetical protein BGX31_010917 [Mortierella sp. GBA43]|nr:hypothetical protein BGX31_010917 [Mortierella sp. GBA43]
MDVLPGETDDHCEIQYFGLVICFIAVQVGNAIAGLLSGSDWIEEALDKSWDIAYQTDQGIIQELQAGFHCMGFRTLDDRVVPMPYNTEMDQPPCEGILRARFGRRLQRLGSLVIYIRLIQLVGVLMLSILFRYLTTMEPLDEDEATSRDEELPYFKSEKEMEEESARVPLLGGDDDEMPGYWQEYGEAESDGEERDEDERDEEMWRIYGDQLSVPAPARWRS